LGKVAFHTISVANSGLVAKLELFF